MAVVPEHGRIYARAAIDQGHERPYRPCAVSSQPAPVPPDLLGPATPCRDERQGTCIGQPSPHPPPTPTKKHAVLPQQCSETRRPESASPPQQSWQPGSEWLLPPGGRIPCSREPAFSHLALTTGSSTSEL